MRLRRLKGVGNGVRFVPLAIWALVVRVTRGRFCEFMCRRFPTAGELPIAVLSDVLNVGSLATIVDVLQRHHRPIRSAFLSNTPLQRLPSPPRDLRRY